MIDRFLSISRSCPWLAQCRAACVEVGAEGLELVPVKPGRHALFQGGDFSGVAEEEPAAGGREADYELTPAGGVAVAGGPDL